MTDIDYRVERWSEVDWLASDKEYHRIMSASNADPLFNSWMWTTLWWRIFGSKLEAKLCVLAIYCKDMLVGIAPFYCRSESRKVFFPTTTVQLVGMSWRNPDVQLSEYLDIVATKDAYLGVQKACIKYIKELYAHPEIIIVSTRAPNMWVEALEHRFGCASYTRSVDASISYQADIDGGFSVYLSNISASARRSLLNLRRRLERHGRVEFLFINTREEALHALHELNLLHATRWGSPAFSGERLEFHSNFILAAMKRGILRMSRLLVGGRPISILYDVRIEKRQYNLQMGFDQTFDNKLSLGLLHLGFSIEDAAHDGVKIYDFLAGEGKKADYKQRLSQASIELRSVQHVDGKVRSCLYRAYDALLGGRQ
ncbi:hypothetical protein ACG33_10145 [Steroidobacter denitrificans]|uniref:BioF2-like acetyltransferase domain-containing protein n=1 Tax=Steroidobacter denitrificans TaxID=465721 RepID=A0A127FAK2_STEDE|nr:GNAT family N-acetyltransferase [Steroidobacter denitrificans]AMN47452.1 hypothetical protein ACG33_10145 [Steroidobacter denitrificans]